jgi:hypothetical protein
MRGSSVNIHTPARCNLNAGGTTLPPPVLCVIAQQYSSPTVVSLRFRSCKGKKIVSRFKNIIFLFVRFKKLR